MSHIATLLFLTKDSSVLHRPVEIAVESGHSHGSNLAAANVRFVPVAVFPFIWGPPQCWYGRQAALSNEGTSRLCIESSPIIPSAGTPLKIAQLGSLRAVVQE